VRCEICGNNRQSDYCKEHCLEKEEQQVISNDYKVEFENLLDEFLRLSRVTFDKFEVQCGELVDKFENKLVEIEMK